MTRFSLSQLLLTLALSLLIWAGVAGPCLLAVASGWGRLEPVTLLLVGVIVNAINGSIFLLINAMRPEITAQNGGPIGFLVGGIQTNLLLAQEVAAAVVCAITFIVLMFLAPA